MSEHKVTVLIDGEELNEEGQAKAIKWVVNKRLAEVENSLIEVCAEELEKAVAQLRVEAYTAWLNENREEFIKALKLEKLDRLTEFLEQSFLEHYAFVPPNRVNVALALKEENEELRLKVSKQIAEENAITEAKNAIERKEVLAEIHQETGCTLWKKGELSKLVEGVEFVNREHFKNFCLSVYEQHFSKKPAKDTGILSEIYEGEDARNPILRNSNNRKSDDPFVEAAVRALGG
jgi:hypothetical protein